MKEAPKQIVMFSSKHTLMINLPPTKYMKTKNNTHLTEEYLKQKPNIPKMHVHSKNHQIQLVSIRKNE